MKFGITGHTGGIGLSLANYCDNNNHEWIGFSRSNGYDINDPHPIIEKALDCDVFINNAHDKYAQVWVLYHLWQKWKEEKKQIVSISSLSPDVTKNTIWPYSTEKCALDHACEQLQNSKGNCRIINIKPGFVDTPRVASFGSGHKMDPDYIAKVVMWCIEQPEYLMTLRIAPYPDPGSSA